MLSSVQSVQKYSQLNYIENGSKVLVFTDFLEENQFLLKKRLMGKPTMPQLSRILFVMLISLTGN